MGDNKGPMTQKRLAEIKKGADNPFPAEVSVEGKIIRELLAEVDLLREVIWDIKVRLNGVILV